MRSREQLISLLPRSKMDVESVSLFEEMETPELSMVAGELLEWTKDSNWPVSEPICRLFLNSTVNILPQIRAILVSGDNEWVWHLVYPLLSKLKMETQTLLIPDLLDFLAAKHEREYDEVIVDFLNAYLKKKYGVGLVVQEGESNLTLRGDIVADISYLKTEDGGKKIPVKTGYRPQFYYNNNDWDAVQEYFEVEWVHPGERAKARVSFLSPDEHLGKLNMGDHFLLREGQRIVAYGHVIEILDLEVSAIRTANWRLKNQKKYEEKRPSV